MKNRNKRKTENESYWKSFTDMMAGLLLVILLVLMLLLLLLTQMNDEEHKEDYRFETYYEEHLADDYDRYKHEYDHENINDSSGGGGGGGGDGVDDPGVNDNEGRYDDIGHDKTAVFVTAIDQETGNVIKQEGILFELYASRNAVGGLMTLHTYYPTKVEYKQYETTQDGTFYLPEKITKGVYSLHNLEAPPGYGIAEDVNFEIDESRDWNEPFLVNVPMEPAKSIIYVQNVDSVTNENVGGEVYEVHATEDVVTLDGTIRYRKGEKVDEFTCDENGRGASTKLYLGKYSVTQKIPAEFYALSRSPISVTLDYLENEAMTYTVKCEKTKAVFTLKDEYTEEPIRGAVYTVTDKEDLSTDTNGKVTVTDLNKSATYTVRLKSVPEPYRISTDPLTFTVDGNGFIENNAVLEVSDTAYIIRLNIDVKDIIFKNSVTGGTIRVYDDRDVVVEEWEATGNEHLIEGLEPGMYALEVNGIRSSNTIIDLKDIGKLQTLTTSVWTIWDTIAAAGALILLTLLVFLAVRIIRRVRKKNSNG